MPNKNENLVIAQTIDVLFKDAASKLGDDQKDVLIGLRAAIA